MSAGGDDETAAKPIVDDTVAKPAGPLEDLPGQEGIAASASEEEPKETEEQRKMREAEEDKKFAKFRGGADPAAAYMANMAAMSSSAATTGVPLGPSGGMPDAVKKYYQTMYGDKWDQQKDPAQGKGTEVIDLINKAKTGRDLVGIVKDRVTSMSGEALWEGVFALSERCTASQKRDLANGKLGLQLSQRMREAMKNLDVNTWIENDTIGRGMYGLAKLNLHMKDRRAYSNVYGFCSLFFLSVIFQPMGPEGFQGFFALASFKPHAARRRVTEVARRWIPCKSVLEGLEWHALASLPHLSGIVR